MTHVPTVVLLVATALLMLTGVIGLLLYSTVYGPRAKLRRRILQVAGQPKGKAMAKGGTVPPRRKALQTKLKQLESTRLKRRGYKLHEAIIQAGLSLSIGRFLLASAGAAVVAALLGTIAGAPPMVIGLVAVIGGVGLPRLLLKVLAGRRVKAFTGQFAGAIDVIVRGIRSGLPVGECFAMIAREMPDPVGTEFRLIVEGQRLGLTVEEVLQRTAERVPTPEIRFFTIVLTVQQSTGGNLAETLTKLSEVLRARKRMHDKVQAMSSEAKASAGIIGSLPIIVGLLLSLVAPDYIGVLFRTETGHLILFVGACIMGTGIVVMRQMIRFDI